MKKLKGSIVILSLLFAVFITQSSFASTENNGFIRQVSPAWGTTDVNPYVSMTVTTDVEIRSTDLTKYVKLIDANGKKVSGVRVGKIRGSTFYVDADSALKVGQQYRLVYMDSIPLAAFTVSSENPVSTAGFNQHAVKRNVSFDKTFEIGFTKQMDADSLTDETIWIENDRGEKVEAVLTLSADKKVATIDPVTNFEAGRMYFLKISGDTQSSSQIGLGTPVIQPFRTVHQ